MLCREKSSATCKPLMSGFIKWIGLLGKWPSEGLSDGSSEGLSDGSSKVSDGPLKSSGLGLGIVGWDLQMDLRLVVPICVRRYTTISLVRIIVRHPFLVSLVYLYIVYVSEMARMCEHMEVWSL